MTIETSDQALIGQTITLVLTAKLESNNEQATDTFTVEFTNGCDSAQLSPVNIVTDENIDISLYELFVIEFEEAVSSLPSCGAIQCQVIDMETG